MSKLLGGNRPFPNIGSMPAPIPYITCLQATKYQLTGLALKVPRRAIPRHEPRDILEVKVMSCREPQREVALYTRHNPSQGSADLDLYQLRAKYGDEFWVMAIGRYPEERFAADYNQMRPKGLENTELEVKDGLWITVDEARLRLEMLGMKHFEGGVTLNVGFGEAGPVKIRKDLKGFSMRMKDHSLVYSMRGGEQILLMHRMPHEEMRVKAVNVSGTAGERRMRFADHLRVASRPVGLEGEYRVNVGTELVVHIVERLSRRTLHGYTSERGDIGEELADAILFLAGCPEVMNHPLDPGRRFDSSRKGSDSLRLIVNQGLVHFEFKWWRDLEAALFDARKEAKRFRRGRIQGKRVIGAYIAILEWNKWSEYCSLNVSRVW